MKFDFSGSVLPGGVTLERASAGTCFDAAGVMQLAGTDVARFDHVWNGSAWVLAGLLVEPARTNLALQSENLTPIGGGGGGWPNQRLLIDIDDGDAPDGTQTMELIRAEATTGTHYGSRQVLVATDVVYTQSLYAAPVSGSYRLGLRLSDSFTSVDWVESFYDLVGKAESGVAQSGGAAEVAARVEDCDAHLRCILTGRPTDIDSGIVRAWFRMATAANAASFLGDETGFQVWGMQVEPGDYVTSYIQTLTTPVTRAADQLTLPLPGGTYDLTAETPAGTFRARGLFVTPGGYVFDWADFEGAHGQRHLLSVTAEVLPAPTVHLLEIQPFDPSATAELSAVPAPFGSWVFSGDPFFEVTVGGGAELHLADGWFNSWPGDAPENQHYAPVLTQPFNFEVRLFDGLEPAGRASVGFGEVAIWNGEGEFDPQLDLGWSGRLVTLLRGQRNQSRGAFATVFRGTTDGITPDDIEIRVRLRDRQDLLARRLQADLYLGTGGLEGGASLTGKRKPLAYGRLFNVPAVLLDGANLVFQVHDGPIAEVLEVRDKGVPLAQDSSFLDYPDYASLLGAAISDGAYATCLAAGLFRLGGEPDGQVTADLRGEDTGGPGGYVETAGDIIRRIVTTRLDTGNLIYPTDFDTNAFDQLAIDQPAAIGYWSGPDSGITLGEALDEIMASIGGWWTFTLTGLLQPAILKAPVGPPDITLTRADLVQGVTFALEGGQPSYRRRVGYRRNWAPQDPGSLADRFLLDPEARQLYGEVYSIATPASDNAVRDKYGQAARDVLTAGLFAEEAPAQAEGERLLALHKVDRRLLRVGVRPENPFAAPLGGVVEIAEFNRLTLSSSKLFRLVGITVDLALGETEWLLWG